MGCLGLIASRRPRDRELPPLVAMVETAAELERIADHAQRVARANYLTADTQLRNPLARLRQQSTQLQVLLDGALSAYGNRDASAARAVADGAQRMEALYLQVREELLGIMKSKPRIANQAIFLSRSAYNLRRAAERVAAICEWVLFKVGGSGDVADLASGDLLRPAEDTQQPVV